MTDPSWRKRTVRSHARLTTAHLVRLGELADQQHREYTRQASEGGRFGAWRNRRVAVVLAQGAACHYLHPDAGVGVKDFDVWTFYAARSSMSLHPGRYETHADFGRSALGRNLYPMPLVGQQKTFDTYQGRRLDFLVRELPVPGGAGIDMVIGALRSWLRAGAAETCRHLEGRKNSSAHHLAHKAMVWIGAPETRDAVGRTVWDSLTDFPGAT